MRESTGRSLAREKFLRGVVGTMVQSWTGGSLHWWAGGRYSLSVRIRWRVWFALRPFDPGLLD
jgi:hypothetical protein